MVVVVWLVSKYKTSKLVERRKLRDLCGRSLGRNGVPATGRREPAVREKLYPLSGWQQEGKMSVNELIFLAEKVRLPTQRKKDWRQKLEDSAEYEAQTLRTSYPWDV